MKHVGGVFRVPGLVTALLAGFMLFIGCEDTPSDEGVDNYFSNNPYQSTSRPATQDAPAPAVTPVTITPTSVSAYPGRLINFRAVEGNSPFTWRVGTPANGSVAVQGDTRYAIYTHLGSTNSPNNVIVTDSSGATAIADVN